MKIGLLNLPIDDNYGGNLQRYALVKVVQDMGHEVTHLLTMRHVKPLKKTGVVAFLKRLVKWIVLYNKCPFGAENVLDYSLVRSFYDKYIKHTIPIFDDQSIHKFNSFDAYIVGSDQVWRKKIVNPYQLNTFMLDFVKDPAKKIAYAVSLGNSKPELSANEADSIKRYYSQFSAVSVREKSALDILNEYRWTNPKAEWLVDPTLLLKKEDYLEVVNSAETSRMEGDMFCYILDSTKEKMDFIEHEAISQNMKPFITGLHKISIEQWLRNFNDAEFIVTDSYHGFVFSMIFNKPVKLFLNEFRGNTRFESLFELLGISKDQEHFDWKRINAVLEINRQKSLTWLQGALDA